MFSTIEWAKIGLLHSSIGINQKIKNKGCVSICFDTAVSQRIEIPRSQSVGRTIGIPPVNYTYTRYSFSVSVWLLPCASYLNFNLIIDLSMHSSS
jgi:hypothetical protein